jgi:hypothetical protein
MTYIVREQGRLMLAGTVAAVHSEATIQQALPGEDSSSFYDPNPEASADAGSSTDASNDTAAEGDFLSISHAPPLRAATSPDAWITPWPIPESVYFVYKSVDSVRGGSRRLPIATAFVLSVPVGAVSSSTPGSSRKVARFLVTARHVVDPAWAHCSNQNPTSIEVRLNRRSGGVGYERIPLRDPGAHPDVRRYFIPADGASDIAIIPLDDRLIPNLDSYKFVDTPFSLLPTESDLRTLVATQQVVTASLRSQVPAEINDFPVSDSGVLSSTTSDPVNIRCGSNSPARALHVWFIDAPIRQGVSGAPVYTSVVREGETTPTAVLLGVQAIAWPDRGLAGITPSSALEQLVRVALLDDGQDVDRHSGAAP